MSADEAEREAGRSGDADRSGEFDLEGVVVRYDGRPDRCTVHPAEPDADERLTAWISVDVDVVRSLGEMR